MLTDVLCFFALNTDCANGLFCEFQWDGITHSYRRCYY
jgi:hypothetical protein